MPAPVPQPAPAIHPYPLVERYPAMSGGGGIRARGAASATRPARLRSDGFPGVRARLRLRELDRLEEQEHDRSVGGALRVRVLGEALGGRVLDPAELAEQLLARPGGLLPPLGVEPH